MPALNKNYFLFFVFALSACAKEGPRATVAPPASPNGAAPLVKVEPVASYQEALATVRDTTLSCSDSECPAHVGLFLAADKAGGFFPGSDAVAACTAALVGDDLALTNSHCLPSAVKLLPSLCAERIRIVFPHTGTLEEESIACAELIGHSERATNVSPDLALVRLERKTGRPFAQLGKAGVPNGSALLSVKVDPDLKNLRGLLRSETCVSAAGSYRMPIYRDASSPALVLGDCTAVPGNSGSPLFDGEGKLVAVTQAALPISETSTREWTALLENKDQGIAPLALATQAFCLVNELPTWSWNEICATVTEQYVALARPRIRLLLPSLAGRAETLLAPYLTQTPLMRFARAEIETRPLRRAEELRPACLEPTGKWAAAFTGPDGHLPEMAEIELETPRLSLELRFNRYLQSTAPSVKIAGLAKRKFSFSPRLAATENTLTLNPAGDGEPIFLAPCGQENE